LHSARWPKLRSLPLLALLGFILFLGACQDSERNPTGGGGPDQTIPTPEPIQQQVATAAPSRRGSTLRATPLPSRATQPSQPVKPSPPVETEAPSALFSICSPLVDSLLEECSLLCQSYHPPPEASCAIVGGFCLLPPLSGCNRRG
jgi:hypothetical protein